MLCRLRTAFAAGATAYALAIGAAPASAIVVYDPTNYAQNVLQAARALEQINNQIQSLQNEAQSLINQARNLALLPYSSLQALQQSVGRTQQLLAQAQGIAHQVADIDQAFKSTYAPVTASTTNAALVATAQARWKQSVQALEDSLKVQAGVVGNLDINRSEMKALIDASQEATGALQATQAGNQLLALQAEQLADLTAAIAAQGRAQSFDAAQRVTAQDTARENMRRFLSAGSGYQPSTVTMFHR
jgi:P-type conjugative transfer protein TrbJ